jgi:hypothetical protein
MSDASRPRHADAKQRSDPNRHSAYHCDNKNDAMRWILSLALWLLALGICRADGLPAAGAALALKPTPLGYEARIDLPPQKFVEARISSPDPGLSPLLRMTSWKEETPAPPPPGAPAPLAATLLKLLTVTLTSGAIAQGQYPVTLSLAGTEPKTIDFLLVVPAARIEPIDTLIVYRNRWPGDTVANQPQILESSGRQWLTNISLMQRGETDAGPEPAGRLQVNGKIADLPPGGSGLIELGKDYALEGDFPLGIAKGKLVLKADQLAEPVNFTFEIHSRIPFVWMLVPMVLGLLLSWASRNWLTGQLNLAREKQKPLALLTAIEASLARNADSAFQASAQAVWNDTKQATQLRTREEVQVAATAAQTKFETAVAALTTRRAAFDMALAEFRAVVETPYRLPAEAARSLLLMRRHLDDGLEGVAPNDVELAGRALDEARAGFGQALVQASHTWERTMTALAAAMEALAPVAGPTVTVDTVKALRSVEQTVSQARQKIEATPLPTVESIKALLEGLHGGIYSVESLLSQFAAAIEQEVAHAQRILGPLSLQDDSAWAKWTAAARQRATVLTNLAVSDPGQLMESLRVAGELDLRAMLLDALAAQLAAGDKAEVTQLATAVEQGGASAGASKLAELLQNVPLHAKTPVGVAIAPRPAAPAEAPKAPVQLPAVQPPSVSLRHVEAWRDGLVPTAVLVADNRRRIETSDWMLSCIYATVIIVGGYFLYASKWIGTPADFAAVFFWAYAIDIGADAAVNAAKAIRS